MLGAVVRLPLFAEPALDLRRIRSQASTRKTATAWPVTRSGKDSKVVTLIRGRRRYFLLTWETL
jgi:hypothetical protein